MQIFKAHTTASLITIKHMNTRLHIYIKKYPFTAELFNRSLSTGHVPTVFKEAFIMPIVKKPGLDSADASSYGRFLTYRCCQSFSNGSQLVNCWTTCQLTTSCLLYSPVFVLATRLKLPRCMCSQNISWLSTVATSLR